ncbi:site-specific recombinase DNA invertase pin [Streptomyces laurentii]|uniref:Site-specific recombinase DNA invertase pin n=1 Tax=Streptomyces laurentii TaxID=39478 RepID=A0A160P411_STRLU|nr:site-specific recombinase DNA invertase pin [Streptomyces laurentii]
MAPAAASLRRESRITDMRGVLLIGGALLWGYGTGGGAGVVPGSCRIDGRQQIFMNMTSLRREIRAAHHVRGADERLTDS